MVYNQDLSGIWGLELDIEKKGIEEKQWLKAFTDNIILPSSTSLEKKGQPNSERETGFLTDSYKFEGFAWFSKEFEVDKQFIGKPAKLFLERTRMTKVWINGVSAGESDSLSTSHIYEIGELLKEGKNNIVILVNNIDYPTRGGHMTSADTQSNWNGIVGKLEILFYDNVYITDIKAYPDLDTKGLESVKLDITVSNTLKTEITDTISIEDFIIKKLGKADRETGINSSLTASFGVGESIHTIEVPINNENLELWSEYNPAVYEITLRLGEGTKKISFGMRKFSTNETDFLINGVPTFLRGKHDGLIFPLTGFAPMTLEEWIRVFKISQSYGINHYRFHTCCPPEEAFTAADLLGIYLEPEINFWGTLAGVGEEQYNETEQDYLITEGERILNAYGNHPSFAMMSLGNELWGSAERMGEILRKYKAIDNRHLYTQGCNNFQWYPCILPEDDFFVGVRFTKERQIRGSYAMCDVPLGFVQTEKPSTMINYNSSITPENMNCNSNFEGEQEIEIQYGTGVKRVKAEKPATEFVSNIPIVSHEIGQYETFPNFKEIEKYKGSLKARNFEIFKERFEEKGLMPLAEKYFINSGKFAVECYKQELEAALRTKKMAGFQILDIQDFSGQGTALVGILDAFMDSKGSITDKEWRTFCSDAVIMAEFEKYTFESSEVFTSNILLRYYRMENIAGKKVSWEIVNNKSIIKSGELTVPDNDKNLKEIGKLEFNMPEVSEPAKLEFNINIDSTDIGKTYTLWLYPNQQMQDIENNIIENDGVKLYICKTMTEAKPLLENGERVLLLPNEIEDSIKGFYCTDFWCYPMFRSISESMNREIPVGTMGLLIQNNHKALAEFPSEEYSTPQWYEIVSHSDCAILDDVTPRDYYPIVQMMDNFERNHKLGILFEANVSAGKLLVCTSRLSEIGQYPEVKQFARSIINYALSKDFK